MPAPADTQEVPSLIGLVLYRLRFGLAAVVVLSVVGSIGFVVAEHYGWFDAFYMTVITVSTVGYGEVHRLHGGGRAVAMGLIVLSFSTAVYGVSVLTDLFASGDAVALVKKRRGVKMRADLSDHVIVVGFGRVGQGVVRGVVEMQRDCLVVDKNPDVAAAVEATGAKFFAADATSVDGLEAAGIGRAAALIAAAEVDEINLIVVLTARAAHPDIRIVSRVNEAAWEARIGHAGANVVQSPYRSYGNTLAAAALSPTVLDLHDLPLLGLGTEEIRVDAGSGLEGHSLRDLTDSYPGILVVGLRRSNTVHRWFEIDGPLAAGDVVIALGTGDHLRSLANDALPTAAT